jgi:5-methylcytosine-specific restriction endonuclease McrA
MISHRVFLAENGTFFVGDDEGKPVVPSGQNLEELQDCLIDMLGALESWDVSGGAARSPKWTKVRKEHLAAHPSCAACGSDKSVQVHHKKPFHREPCLELDAENLITLCPVCHLYFGHLLRWTSWNADVSKDSAWFLGKIEGRP